MTELRNCPFCGSNNLSYVLNDNEDQSICCENCSAAGPIHVYQIEAEMVWNTRADGWIDIKDQKPGRSDDKDSQN